MSSLTSLYGTVQTNDHGSLDGLTDDDHTQYLNTTRGDARYYTQSMVDTISGALHAEVLAVSGTGGTSDHGELDGLADDDHTQYLNTTRGDARYYTQSQVDTISGSITTDAASIYAPIAEGVTNGDSHDHSGGDGAQIDHTGLSNIGSNSHSTIDTHLGNTSNPHTVTAAQVGNGTAQWNANKIQGKTLPTPGAGDDSLFLKYDHAGSQFIMATASGGGGSGTSITNGGTTVQVTAAGIVNIIVGDTTLLTVSGSEIIVSASGTLRVLGHLIIPGSAPTSPESGSLWIA